MRVHGKSIKLAGRAAFQAGCATIDSKTSDLKLDEGEHDALIEDLCKRLRCTPLEYFEARAILSAYESTGR